MMMRVSKQDVEAVKSWFRDYVEEFKHGSEAMVENTILKEDHTLRVCAEALAIGKALRLSPNALHIAELCALLHDVGRFEQYRRYGTFVDARSVNHAGLSVTVATSHNVLAPLRENLKNLILQVIACHNQARLPADGSEIFLFFARLLRDADKLDIYKVVTDYYSRTGHHRNKAIELDLPDTDGFSDDVYENLMNRQIVDIRHLKNFNDFKLLQVGWIFDINFSAAFSVVQSRRYLEKIEAALPVSEKLNAMFEMAKEHVATRIREGDPPDLTG